MKRLLLSLDHFMLQCDAKNLSPKTLKSYDQSLKLFLHYVHHEHEINEVDEIKTFHIRSYIKYLKERGKYTITSNERYLEKTYQDRRQDIGDPVSDTTIANYIRNIKVFFNFLHQEGEIYDLPTKNIPNIKPKRKQKKMLEEDEIKKLLNSYDFTKFHEFRAIIMIKLMLDTGCRVGECCDLLPQDIDLKYNAILITNPKNNQQRYVYFSQRMNRELKQWFRYRDRFSDSDFVFPTSRGTRLNINTFETSLRNKGRKLGIEVTPHYLRNSFAKHFLMGKNGKDGGDMATLSKILGHSSIDVTVRAYLDFTNEQTRQMYQAYSPLEKMKI